MKEEIKEIEDIAETLGIVWISTGFGLIKQYMSIESKLDKILKKLEDFEK